MNFNPFSLCLVAESLRSCAIRSISRLEVQGLLEKDGNLKFLKRD